MATLTSLIDTNSEAFRANAVHNRALAGDLRARVATAALGGSEASRERHVARGKLLPRDRVEVTEGAQVVAGQKLVVLEAMKMEHALVAPFAGIVAELKATAGAQVTEGMMLVRIEKSEA